MRKKYLTPTIIEIMLKQVDVLKVSNIDNDGAFKGEWGEWLVTGGN